MQRITNPKGCTGKHPNLGFGPAKKDMSLESAEAASELHRWFADKREGVYPTLLSLVLLG